GASGGGQRAHAHNPDPSRAPGSKQWKGFACHIYVAETDAEAEQAARAAYPDFYENFSWLFALHHDPYPERQRDFDGLVQNGLMLFGSPATIRARLQEIMDLTGCHYFAGLFAWGSLATERIMNSLRLFTDEVMPAIRAGGPKE